MTDLEPTLARMTADLPDLAQFDHVYGDAPQRTLVAIARSGIERTNALVELVRALALCPTCKGSGFTSRISANPDLAGTMSACSRCEGHRLALDLSSRQWVVLREFMKAMK